MLRMQAGGLHVNTRLILLGLLSWGPKHGYDIRRAFETYQIDLWTGVLSGSVYHGLRQLASEGLICAREPQRTGQRVRVVHEITDAGRAELRRLVREELSMAPRSYPVGIYSGLLFLRELPRGEALKALEEARAGLQADRQSWDEGDGLRRETGQMNAFAEACFENGRAHVAADLALLRELQRLLDPESAMSHGTPRTDGQFPVSLPSPIEEPG